MSVELAQTRSTQKENIEPEWTPAPPPTDLIFDDSKPLESNRHRIAMNVLIEAIYRAYQGRNDYFTGGNMFVYYSSEQAQNRDFRGPDFFCHFECGWRKRATRMGSLGRRGTLS